MMDPLEQTLQSHTEEFHRLNRALQEEQADVKKKLEALDLEDELQHARQIYDGNVRIAHTIPTISDTQTMFSFRQNIVPSETTVMDNDNMGGFDGRGRYSPNNYSYKQATNTLPLRVTPQSSPNKYYYSSNSEISPNQTMYTKTQTGSTQLTPLTIKKFENLPKPPQLPDETGNTLKRRTDQPLPSNNNINLDTLRKNSTISKNSNLNFSTINSRLGDISAVINSVSYNRSNNSNKNYNNYSNQLDAMTLA